MKRPAIIVLLAVCCLAHRLPAAEPTKQEKFEKLLAEKPVIPEGVVYKKTTIARTFSSQNQNCKPDAS